MTDHVHTEECAPKPGDLLCIIPGPSHVYKVEPLGELWCFSCRKRLVHEWVLIGDPPDKVSYYDHIWIRRCTGCGHDNTAFPGTIW
jgi:hypothetical protein